MKKIVIWLKHACQNMVAMETSKLMDNRVWCQNVPRQMSGKVTKFGGYSFKGLEVTNLQSWRGLQKPPPPPPPGLDRVKQTGSLMGKETMKWNWCSNRSSAFASKVHLLLVINTMTQFFDKGKFNFRLERSFPYYFVKTTIVCHFDAKQCTIKLPSWESLPRKGRPLFSLRICWKKSFEKNISRAVQFLLPAQSFVYCHYKIIASNLVKYNFCHLLERIHCTIFLK